MSNDLLLKVENLTIQLQLAKQLRAVVTNLNFSLCAGETLALVGESGSGKTLTGLALMRLLPPAIHIDSASSILFKQQNLLDLSEIQMRSIRGRQIGMIFQEALTALNPVLTIGNQMSETLRRHFKLPRRICFARACEWLKEVGIHDPLRCARSYPHQLSGGQRQRAMIAMALAGEPDLLIADEPTTSLDVILQAQILELLLEQQRRRKMALLFITHDFGVVAKIAQRVMVMHRGELIEQGTVSTFFQAPQHPYSQQLLAALPDSSVISEVSVADSSSPLLKVMNLQVHYAIGRKILRRSKAYMKAVDDVSFSLPRARTLALIGESGCGKTTTAMSILQLIKITAGQIQLDGIELTTLSTKKLRSLRRHFQIVFQDPYASLNPRMVVFDILSEGLRAQQLLTDKTTLNNRIDELLAQVDLPLDCKFRYPHEFSGGQRQRICIARALSLNPRLIVCDEPTSALDATTQLQILQLLQRFQFQLGISYLLITHNFAVVRYLAHEVAVMEQGKIVEYGATKQVLTQPQHPYTKRLLAAIFKIKEET